MAVVKEKQSKVTLCEVFLGFKSLLLFIYELIHFCINKLSGQNNLLNTLKPSHASVGNGSAGNNNTKLVEGRIKDIWEIPGPRPLPFVGTLFTSSELKMGDLMKANEDRIKKYGPVVKEEHFWNFPLIMVLDGEDIKKVIRANPIMRPGMEILVHYRSLKPDRYDTLGLVNSQGPTWKKLHSIFATLITNMKFVRSLLPGFLDITTDIIDSLAGKTGPTDALPQILNKLIGEASFYIAFGKRIGSSTVSHEKMLVFTDCHDIYWKAFHRSMYGFPWWKYMPSKTWNDFTTAEDDMIKMIDEVSDDLMQSGTAGGVLAAVPKDQLTKNDLNVVLLELMTGATEPVHHALVITLYWISKHERVYNRILEELREHMPTKDSPVDEKALENIPYLKACVMETFRICPTTCNVARFLEKEMEVGGYKLPQYTAVILQSWHACLQDTNFYRAKEFLPERWLFKDGLPPFKPHERQIMTNFGLGTRACPGRRIATQLINTFLCKLLRKYRVKFTKEVDISYEWLLVVKEPVEVEFIEHET